MTDALRWGILATGGIAHMFTSDLVANGFTVQAVGSRSQESADAFAAEFDIPHAHADYAALAADPEVDIIYVSTPHPFHAEHATLALNAGKHVLVEKPFTINAEEAEAVIRLAREKNLLVLEAMWTRWLPHMVRIREIIAAGTLGDVRTLIADHTQDLPDDPGHRLNDLALGGGALLDLGIYPISFSFDLFGEPETVQAVATFKETGADAQVATLFRYSGDQVASTLSASDTAGPNAAMVLGTDARIEIDGVWYSPTTFRVVKPDGEVLESFTAEVTGRGMQFQAAEAERLIAAGRISGDILSTDETLAIMRTLDTIRDQIGLRYPGE
ncbi:Gfo/Idh/MocA family oxidoreductase [Glaciibacter flavus]|uniref:Gfo/Idh/MocA family oxidoreductase n=1 Tax=Orlajensenia flava TaxID=2565934 RepID=A0A4S4FL55_9MICO|nr:Gfo/Idh/MocA family oxidoreductase [Glaciibacter flavus]THG31193.1 Gfo/Idh/MocA family oxidoreductase [Glaciibacter flavus]